MHRELSSRAGTWCFLRVTRRDSTLPWRVQVGLGESGRAGGEITQVVLVGKAVPRGKGGAVGGQPFVVLRVRGAVLPGEQEDPDFRLVVVRLERPMIRPEDHGDGVRQVEAIPALLRRVPEVQGHRDGAGLEDPEVDRQPFQAVHQEDGDLVALPDPAFQQQVGKAVRLLREAAPGHRPAVSPAGCSISSYSQPPPHISIAFL
jgi:hypothetical protein